MVQKVEVDLKRIAEKTKRKLVTVAREFTQDMAEAVVARTPVDTGFLRGSWFVSIGDGVSSYVGENDTSGASTIARMSVTINGAEIGDVIQVLNGAPYAEYVEFGTSKMAPRAFVRSTVADANQIAEQTIRRIAAE